MKNKTTTKHNAPTRSKFWVIGRNYFIRTVTYHHTGVLLSITDGEIILGKAAWIAESGRFQQALNNCEFSEVEMFPSNSAVMIGRGSIIDAVQIKTLPTLQK